MTRGGRFRQTVVPIAWFRGRKFSCFRFVRWDFHTKRPIPELSVQQKCLLRHSVPGQDKAWLSIESNGTQWAFYFSTADLVSKG